MTEVEEVELPIDWELQVEDDEGDQIALLHNGRKMTRFFYRNSYSRPTGGALHHGWYWVSMSDPATSTRHFPELGSAVRDALAYLDKWW